MNAFFYFYSGIIGDHNLFMDVLSGIVGVLVAVYISYDFFTENKKAMTSNEVMAYSSEALELNQISRVYETRRIPYPPLAILAD